MTFPAAARVSAIRGRGTYVLVLRLATARSLRVGRLGTFQFPAGRYLYVGSALNGLESRIRRHLRRRKVRKWHVDYLRAVAPVVEVWWTEDTKRLECAWATVLGAQARVPGPAAGFGASDCRCRTHLVFAGDCTEVARLRGALPETSERLQISPR